jgi:citrate synthase
VDEKRLKDVLEQIPDEKVEFQIIDIDQELEKIVLEGKKFLNQRFLYPLMDE